MMKKISILMIALFVSMISCTDDDEVKKSTATFKVTLKNVFMPKMYQDSGTFELIKPNEEQELSFHAGKGSYLSFATMFVKSNDLFYGFSDSGLALYDANGDPVTGNISMKIKLWDAGTEVNQEPGAG